MDPAEGIGQVNKNASITVGCITEFPFPAEEVFDAWIDPAKVSRWLFAAPGGKIVSARIDARPKGKFIITDRRDGEDWEHVGEYVEIDRPHKLVFRFAVPKASPDYTTVTVEITPQGNRCVQTLMHSGVPAAAADRAEAGWARLAEGLAATLA